MIQKSASILGDKSNLQQKGLPEVMTLFGKHHHKGWHPKKYYFLQETSLPGERSIEVICKDPKHIELYMWHQIFPEN